jgi:effector-binding domain-containing protein
MDVGYLLNDPWPEPLPLTAQDKELTTQYQLTPATLPAVPTMASIIHKGWDDGVISYNALGQWIEANGYTITGPCREILLSLHWPNDRHKNIIEIQFPVQKELAQ